jgi:hypothetical protein
MAREVSEQAAEWAASARRWREAYQRAADELIATARRCAEAGDEDVRSEPEGAPRR